MAVAPKPINVDFEWPSVEGVTRYDIFKDGKKVSTRQGVESKVSVVAGTKVKIVPQVKTTPVPAANDELATYNLGLTPNYVGAVDEEAKNYNSIWVYGHSPATPYLSQDSRKAVDRCMLVDPNTKDLLGNQGNDEWWVISDILFPLDWDVAGINRGSWGRCVNLHNGAGGLDTGHDGGVGWGFPPGNSAIAVDWLPGHPTPSVNIEPAISGGLNVYAPRMNLGKQFTTVVHFIAGRTDGSTVRPGEAQVWFQGYKVFDAKNINTIWRAQDPVDNQYYTQKWMMAWDGWYTQNLQAKLNVKLALMRLGHTFEEALADRPIRVTDTMGGQHYKGSGANLGNPTLSREISQPLLASKSVLPVF